MKFYRPARQIANLGDFRFENGEVVSDFKVSFVTHGQVNANRDNVVLYMHDMGGHHLTLNGLSVGTRRSTQPSTLLWRRIF